MVAGCRPTEDYENPKAYGGLKVPCERTISDIIAGRAFIPRPSLVVGPRDPTDLLGAVLGTESGGDEVEQPA